MAHGGGLLVPHASLCREKDRESVCMHVCVLCGCREAPLPIPRVPAGVRVKESMEAKFSMVAELI